MRDTRGVITIYVVHQRTFRVLNNAVHTHARTSIRTVLKTPQSIPNFCMYRYGELTFSHYFFSVWTHKLRLLAKLLHIPKRAENANALDSVVVVIYSAVGDVIAAVGVLGSQLLLWYQLLLASLLLLTSLLLVFLTVLVCFVVGVP